jgi:hypothetical protein
LLVNFAESLRTLPTGIPTSMVHMTVGDQPRAAIWPETDVDLRSR